MSSYNSKNKLLYKTITFKTLRLKKIDPRSKKNKTRRGKINQSPRQASTPPKGIPPIFEESDSYRSSRSSSASSTPISPIRLNRTSTPESLRFIEMKPIELSPEVINPKKTSNLSFMMNTIKKSIANLTRRKNKKST